MGTFIPNSKSKLSFGAGLLLLTGVVAGEPIKMKHGQGEVHAFLAVRTESGKLLGTADEVNVPMDKTWRSRLTIRFRDGSVDDDTAIYTQGSVLRLVSDHHVQKGPSFPSATDVTIKMASGDVLYHEQKDGKDSVVTEHMDLPVDLANGIMPTLLQNFPKGAAELKVGYLVTTPKPRLVKVAIHPDGPGTYRMGGFARSANKYRMHVEIGGIAGILAPLVGKEPPDLMAWVSTGEAPTFLKLYGFLYLGGPMWRMELTSPEW